MIEEIIALTTGVYTAANVVASYKYASLYDKHINLNTKNVDKKTLKEKLYSMDKIVYKNKVTTSLFKPTIMRSKPLREELSKTYDL